MHTGIADLLAGQTAVKSSVDALIARGTLVDAAEAKLAGRIKVEYEKRFQSAKQKFEAGMILQARDAFVEILRDLKLDAEIKDPVLLGRAYTNLGTCEWHAGNTNAAAQYFEEAYSYNPDDVRCIANLASAQMLRGEPVAALKTVERALALEPENEVAVSTKGNILLSEGRHDEAVGFAKEKTKDSLSKYFQAMKFVYEGHRQGAIAIFRELVAAEPDNTEYLSHLAANIMLHGQSELMREHTLPWRMPVQLREAFWEAEVYLSNVIDSLKTKELQQKLLSAYVNRSGVRMMLGKATEAIA